MDAISFDDGSRTPARRRRRRRARFATASILVVAAGVLVASLALREHNRSDPYDDPSGVALPDVPADRSALTEYLASPDGASVRQVLAASSAALAPGATDTGCARSIAVLDAAGTPQQVFARVAAIPDADTAAMATSHLEALTELLGACVERHQIDGSDAVSFFATVMQRRLDQIGVSA